MCSSDLIHPNHKPANIPVPPNFQQHINKQQQHPPQQQQQQGPPPGPSFPKILNAPSAPQTFGDIRPPVQQQQQHHQQQPGPKPAPPGFQGTDAQFANSVFRELFDNKQKEKLRQQGPFFGGPRPHKEIVSNDLQAEGGQFGPPVHSQFGAPIAPVAHFPVVPVAPVLQQPLAAGPWPDTPDGDMSKIVSLEVKCEKNVMRVYIAFDKPFHGVIFSKVHRTSQKIAPVLVQEFEDSLQIIQLASFVLGTLPQHPLYPFARWTWTHFRKL